MLIQCTFLLQTEDLAQFRQWGSRTPGHPENFETPGVEVTTGEGSQLSKSTLTCKHWFCYEDANVIALRHSLHSRKAYPTARIQSTRNDTATNSIVSLAGPLGQGIANAVGLALAEAHLAARYNKPDAKVVDHYT